MKYFLYVVIALAINIQCTPEAVLSPDILCTYYKEKSESITRISENDCVSENFIIHLENIDAKMEFLSDINTYVIIYRINNTYDCQILGILCDDYSNLLGKSIIFSGDVYEYYGGYQAPIGGLEIFLVKNFKNKI